MLAKEARRQDTLTTALPKPELPKLEHGSRAMLAGFDLRPCPRIRHHVWWELQGAQLVDGADEATVAQTVAPLDGGIVCEDV